MDFLLYICVFSTYLDVLDEFLFYFFANMVNFELCVMDPIPPILAFMMNTFNFSIKIY